MSTEEWRMIPGFPGYAVSSHGRVRSGASILRRRRHSKGYLTVALYRNGRAHFRYVHRLVATAFIPNPDSLPCVRHRNEVPYENNVSNLVWGTHGDNGQDRVQNSSRPARTHCKRGHELTDDNTYTDRGHIVCRTCKLRQVADYDRRRKELSHVN